MFVPGNPFQSSLMFVCKAMVKHLKGALLGYGPILQRLDKAGKACQRKTLLTHYEHLYSTDPKCFITLIPDL
jgi:hypothetical protein